jgi:hypothetical protein
MTRVLSWDSAITAPFLVAVTLPVAASTFSSISSPMSIWPASISIGSAPASSMVLKKIGAILEPRQTPPKRLFGTKGMSSPVNHSTELVADLREEPVPTTSPT